MKIKCSKIVYDPDFAKPGMKKTMTVEIDYDWLDVIMQSDDSDDSEEAVSELNDTLEEEIERLVGCPVVSIGKYSV